MSATAARGQALARGVRLEVVTVAWMAAEAAIAIGAGVFARSVLLTAFGADSVIELLSGVIILWRLRAEARGEDASSVDRADRVSTWISAGLLILLCVYVAATSVAGLVFRIEPERSYIGIGVALLALVVMPLLASRKRAVNTTLQNAALRADIAESLTCAFLAAVTLVGVGAAALTGWWWFEYLAAFALLRWLVPEALEALAAARGDD